MQKLSTRKQKMRHPIKWMSFMTFNIIHGGSKVNTNMGSLPRNRDMDAGCLSPFFHHPISRVATRTVLPGLPACRWWWNNKERYGRVIHQFGGVSVVGVPGPINCKLDGEWGRCCCYVRNPKEARLKSTDLCLVGMTKID